jgi:hypothetical protein
MKKLAIQVPSDEELYDYAAPYKCFRCPEEESQFKDEPRVSHGASAFSLIMPYD